MFEVGSQSWLRVAEYRTHASTTDKPGFHVGLPGLHKQVALSTPQSVYAGVVGGCGEESIPVGGLPLMRPCDNYQIVQLVSIGNFSPRWNRVSRRRPDGVIRGSVLRLMSGSLNDLIGHRH